MVDEELEGDWAKKTSAPTVCSSSTTSRRRRRSPAPLRPAERRWPRVHALRHREREAQKQQGFSTVEVKVTRGDLKPEQFRGLAAIMREYAGGRARTTIHQNIVLRWVRDESLYEVWKRAEDTRSRGRRRSQITDVVSCPGTDSCKLGITASMGLNAAIQAKVESMQIVDPLTQKIHIKMSGCPNSCGQHHIAQHRLPRRSDEGRHQQLPAYHVFVGGAYDGAGCASRPSSSCGCQQSRRRRRWRASSSCTKATASRAKIQRFLRPCGDEVPSKTAVQDLVLPGDFMDDNDRCSSTGPASSCTSHPRRRRVRHLGSAWSQNKRRPGWAPFCDPKLAVAKHCPRRANGSPRLLRRPSVRSRCCASLSSERSHDGFALTRCASVAGA